jgi:hypothetical protein
VCTSTSGGEGGGGLGSLTLRVGLNEQSVRTHLHIPTSLCNTRSRRTSHRPRTCRPPCRGGRAAAGSCGALRPPELDGDCRPHGGRAQQQELPAAVVQSA